MNEPFAYCPRCGRPMIDRTRQGRATRRECAEPSCGFVQRTNPVPCVGALVEHEGEMILARNVGWPDGWFALIAGYLESREDPRTAVRREVKEELDLDVVEVHPIGNYIFERKNEVMLCYHAVATGTIRLGAELSEYRRYQPHELRPWPRASGLAVADWMTARGLPFEFEDFPGAASWLEKADNG